MKNQKDIIKPSTEKPVVGWFCIYTPVEILEALDLHPYRILGNYEKITDAAAYLQTPVCPYLRNCFDAALKGRYDFLAGVIFNNSCTTMNRLYYLWKQYIKTPFVHLLDVPRVLTPGGIDFYAHNIEQMIDALSRHFGVSFHKENLLRCLSLREQAGKLLKRLSSYGGDEEYKISFAELQGIVNEGFHLPLETFIEKLTQLLKEVGQREPIKPGKKRILISGSHCSNPEVIPIMEELGFQVVYADLCTAHRWFEPKEYETGPGAIKALAKAYLGQSQCARMKDSAGRHQRLFEIIERENIAGVVLFLTRYCCTYIYDFSVLGKKLDELSIPNLLIEGDYTTGNTEQIRTRLEVFAEILANRNNS